MRTKMLTALTTALCFVMMLQITAHSDGESFNWYCMRKKNHMQPVCESNMKFIENYGGYYVDKKHGDTSSSKVIYLTFDAGYENGNVERILDTLKEKDVPGAFFILSNLITKNTDLVKRMTDEGHLVCNHTASHRDMTKLTTPEAFSAELEKLEKIYTHHTGREMSRYYRPPAGKFSEQNMKFANDLGYKTIFWSFAYADWDNNKQPNPDAAFKLIMDNAHNGAVILLHPTSKTNADILGKVIDALKSEGYSFGTLEELTDGK